MFHNTNTIGSISIHLSERFFTGQKKTKGSFWFAYNIPDGALQYEWWNFETSMALWSISISISLINSHFTPISSLNGNLFVTTLYWMQRIITQCDTKIQMSALHEHNVRCLKTVFLLELIQEGYQLNQAGRVWWHYSW